jgi:hypothetical protein
VSYARFAKNHSDVYVYEASDNIQCCSCSLGFRHNRNLNKIHRSLPTFVTTRRSVMIKHLEQHAKQGQKVPEYVFKRLRKEMKRFDRMAPAMVWMYIKNGRAVIKRRNRSPR